VYYEGVIAKHPLDQSAECVGGASVLAGILGVSVQAVNHWKDRGVPLERCVAIERATNGIVTRKDLRPDDWQNIWPELGKTLVQELEDEAGRERLINRRSSKPGRREFDTAPQQKPRA